jgi:arylesterase/paraoxonase
MKRFLVITVLVLGFFVLKTLYQAGQFKTIKNSFSGDIITIYNNVPGPEDMQLDRPSQTLFISGSVRRDQYSSKAGIYKLDLEQDSQPKYVFTTLEKEFNPHGISLFREDSTLYLFAVNHNSKGDFIESFYFKNDTLFHLESFDNSKMCCPNDVLAVAPDKFYVTNDHGSKRGNWKRIIEDYLRIPFSNVFYFNGASFIKAAGPFHYANGINISPDKQVVYVSETTGAAISAYTILDDGSLFHESTIDVDTGADNIDIDEDGNLWVAAHPKLLDFVNHVKDSVNLSPSQILKIQPKADFTFTVEEVYLNDGSEVSASSIAVPYKNELFIGVVLNHTMLRAKMD